MIGRSFWRLVGWALFALGLLGLVLPVLPTTVFWILAVIAVQKADPDLAAKIRAWPGVGPAVSDFLDHGVISTRGKLIALTAMAASGGLLALTLANGPLLWSALAGLSAAALFVSTRRGRRRDRSGRR
ncbi:MAG: DUF454 family protein [Pseudomonadota bacterium]